MREGFEKNIHAFGAHAKDRSEKSEAEVSKEELRGLEMIENTAVEMGTSIDTQIEVYYKQQKKQEIMDALHDRLRGLDAMHERKNERGERAFFESVGEGKTVYWDDAKGYFLRGKKNEGEIPITKGEIMTDGMWGVSYRIDSSVERGFAKRFFVETARRELFDLLDEQVALTEADSDVNRGSGNDAAYEAFRRRQEKNEDESNGILAERMTESYLLKLSYDHEVPFEVHHADPEMDVEDKIDFILSIRGYNRGVDVNVGIQFTTSVSSATIRHKEKQIEQVNKRLHAEKGSPVQDVILVTIPLRETKEVFNTWNSAKQKHPGGPDALWSIDTKRAVFEGVLQKLHNLVPPDEIASLWEQIESGIQNQ